MMSLPIAPHFTPWARQIPTHLEHPRGERVLSAAEQQRGDLSPLHAHVLGERLWRLSAEAFALR